MSTNNLDKNTLTLVKKILFTILCLLICRLGAFIPVPGVNSIVLEHIYSTSDASNGMLGILNMLSGGSLGRMSIFALAIMPYITSSIIVQILSLSFPSVAQLRQEGDLGKRKINQITRFLTILLSIFESYAISSKMIGLTSSLGKVVILDPTIFKFLSILTLTTGTISLMWIGEQINIFGIGNGTSLIIFTGIVSGVPSSLFKAFSLVRVGTISGLSFLLSIFSVVSMVFIVVFFERAHRKIPIQYPKRQIGNKVYSSDTSYMPIKLNTAGVIPPIFASALLSFPVTLLSLYNYGPSDGILSWFSLHFSHGKPFYIISYAFLIAAMTFMYTAVVFDSKETAENLRKQGAYVPGRRPGDNTADFFEYVLFRITSLGVFYLIIVCIFPEIVSSYNSVFLVNLTGTTMVILVNVVLDTVSQIQTHIFTNKYDNMIKKSKLRSK